MPTIKDVARVARVSVATVSATLSGKSYVSPELKTRVLEAVAKLDYAPNSVASGLKRGRMNLIGLIVPDITNPFHTEIVRAVQDRAQARGYAVLLVDSEQSPDRETELLKLMRSHGAAGIILCPTATEEHYGSLTNLIGQMPLVALDSPLGGAVYDTILLDNAEAGRLAAEHILGFGHRRVGAVIGPPGYHPSAERLRGFEKALNDAQIPSAPELIETGHFRQKEGYDACERLLAARERPTALFVANNQMLIGVMRALAFQGLHCPDDLSVVSIDDFPWASAFTPKLTVVRQPIEEMASLAVEMLLRRIDNIEQIPVRQATVAPKLEVRSSCAAPAVGTARGQRRSRIGAHRF